MEYFKKIRGELIVCEVEMKHRLAAGETMVSPTVTIWKKEVDTLVDVTSEFVVSDATVVDGTKIQFQLKEATEATEQDPATQLPGIYCLFAESITSESLSPVASVDLYVFEK